MNSNNKLVNLLKNASYTLLSNIITLLISVLVILIIPKFIGVKDYGYWQLYIFYTSYIGFLHFGWNDGLYLRLGGTHYEKLDKPTYFSQFYLLTVSQIALAVVAIISIYFFDFDNDKKYVLYMTAICMIITNVRYMLLFLLQATDKIKQYSTITIIDSIIYVLIIAALLLGKFNDFKFLIWADLFGRILSLLYAVYVCKDIIFLSVINFKWVFDEIYENIQVGIKLLFSNIASKLIVGNVRFGVEHVWSIAVFGKLSLTLSISNFVMIFINAISLVLFPFLRKIDENNLIAIYNILRNVLSVMLFGILLVYYPLTILLEYWLPEYQDSLKYMAILFPMCLFEGKMSLLISTYLKVLRKEKLLLKINIATLILSIVLTFISIYFLKNLDLAVLTILFLIAFRSIIAEIYLQKVIDIKIVKDIIFEILLTAIFIIASWNFSLLYALLIYSVSYIMFLFFNKEKLLQSIKIIKTQLKLR